MSAIGVIQKADGNSSQKSKEACSEGAARQVSRWTEHAVQERSQKLTLESLAQGSAEGRAQLCPTLCDPMDCSPPGSSVRGITQARILGWVAISFPRGSSRPRNRVCLLH